MSERTKTHVTLLLDASGSMSPLQDDVIGATNQFADDQAKIEGECKVSVIAFDSHNHAQILRDRVNVNDYEPITATEYVPRGGTPLLDAMGEAIQRIKDKPKWQQVFAVYDFRKALEAVGQENSSAEWTNDSLAKLVKAKTDDHEWRDIHSLSSPLSMVCSPVAA